MSCSFVRGERGAQQTLARCHIRRAVHSTLHSITCLPCLRTDAMFLFQYPFRSLVLAVLELFVCDVCNFLLELHALLCCTLLETEKAKSLP